MIGEWYQLRATLAWPAGLYKVIDVTADTVLVANRAGERHSLSRDQFEALKSAPGEPPSGARVHDSIPFHEQGMLSAVGYRAGRKGLPASQRRSLLRGLIERPSAELPRINEAGYREAWGDGNTYPRLRKTLTSLNTLATNSSLKANPAEEAIQHWRSDAAWLLSEYRPLLPLRLRPEDWAEEFGNLLFPDSGAAE